MTARPTSIAIAIALTLPVTLTLVLLGVGVAAITQNGPPSLKATESTRPPWSYDPPVAYLRGTGFEVQATLGGYAFQDGSRSEELEEHPISTGTVPPGSLLSVRVGQEVELRLKGSPVENPKVSASVGDQEVPIEDWLPATITSADDRLPATIRLPSSAGDSSLLRVEVRHAAGHLVYYVTLNRIG
jgi:hypothetical protein